MNRFRALAAGAALALAVAAPARAEVVINDSIFVQVAPFVPCANNGQGEVVHLSGPLHVLVSFNSNGKTISGKTHFQPQGISGIGEISGDHYQGTGVTQTHFKGSFEQGAFLFTHINNFRIIGRGPGNNLLVHENVHFQITENGEFRSVHDNFRVDCK